MDGRVINIGVLGTARVTSYALVEPAKQVEDITIAAVASRSLEKAQKFAALHGVPKAFSSYDALLEQEDIDAVYVALPTALHPHWTLRALERGKHVLCEKPLAPNAMLAQMMVSAAQKRGRVLHEGMHLFYLQSLRRQRELIVGGALGRIGRISCVLRHPNIEMIENDFRLRYELGGGAALDLGCYAVTCLRYVAGEDPDEIDDVRVECVAPDVDSWMQAHVRFPSCATGMIECGFRGNYSQEFRISVDCEGGSITLDAEGVTVAMAGNVVREAVPLNPTFPLQLEAFAKQVRGEAANVLPPESAVATARVIDELYKRAGLAPRMALLE